MFRLSSVVAYVTVAIILSYRSHFSEEQSRLGRMVTTTGKKLRNCVKIRIVCEYGVYALRQGNPTEGLLKATRSEIACCIIHRRPGDIRGHC
ncbi:hypothetical protein PoB_004004800 [Plakobranchus ocellatus]|uniref:Secreted protein n=1 Tax=Plakobranchus ocellatus TaxID=259542 RepID=A0AAV4B455_9GAST|nr:hypothetical protein PoB_004004800 [Plakobranchus ocellatus]